MFEKIQRKIDVLYDIVYVIKNARMAKRIRSGESISIESIKKTLLPLLKLPGLTKEQFMKVQDYYYPYKVSTLLHRQITDINGNFREDYLPSEMYYAYIDPYLNDKKKGAGLENKCLFPKLFAGINQPQSIAYRMNGMWLDEDYSLITSDDLVRILSKEKDVFIKKADDSYGGIGVRHLKIQDNIPLSKTLKNIIGEIHGDIIIQRSLHQHKEMARLNPNSVNTLRIVSLLTKDGVKILGSILRCSSDEKSVDNITSGGIMCYADEKGCLKKYGYSFKKKFETHPLTKIRFEGFRIPSYDKVIELVRKAHPMLPYFRFVGWDIAIGEDGEPVLIEANLCTTGIETIQMGGISPIFGDDTKKIISEALKNTDYPKRHKRRCSHECRKGCRKKKT